jgi:hypothetical protein
MNMKKIKLLVIAALAALGLTLTSCEKDFFDNGTDSALPNEVLYGSPEGINQNLIGIYAMFSNNNIYRNRLACGAQGMNSDIEFNSKTGAVQLQLNRYNCLTSNSDISNTNKTQDVWSVLTTMIDRCNEVLAGVDNELTSNGLTVDSEDTNPEVQYLYGELLTLRAFVYLEMIKFWGDVPAKFSPIVAGDDNTIYVPKADRNVIFERLRSDLKFAATLMGWSDEIAFASARNNVTKMNKAFTLGLLARNNLMYAGYALRASDPALKRGERALQKGETWAVQLNVDDETLRKELYQEVVNATGEVIARYGTEKLAGDFSQIFKDICQDRLAFSRTEWIWTMAFQARGARGQFMNYNAIKSKDALYWLKNVATSTGNNVQMVVPTLFYDFEQGDNRKWVTVAPFTWMADAAAGISSDVTERARYFPGTEAMPAQKRLYQKNVDISGIYLGKYRYEWMKRPYESGDDGVDYPVMRYADILLMYAEASIGSMNGDVPANPSYVGAMSPQEAYNAVRARAGLAPKDLNMDNIIKERAFEFCGEYIRKYDLMRWGILKKQLVDTQKRIQDINESAKAENIGSPIGEDVGKITTFPYIYFKYKLDDSFLDANVKINDKATIDREGQEPKAYVFDGNVIGLGFGESIPAEYSDENTVWVRKNPFADEDTNSPRLGSFSLYNDENLIDRRHYWAIFDLNSSGSNGTLWNDLW